MKWPGMRITVKEIGKAGTPWEEDETSDDPVCGD